MNDNVSEEPKMITIEVSVRLGLTGCHRESTFKIEADAGQGAIEEAAKDVLFDLIEWNWEIKEND